MNENVGQNKKDSRNIKNEGTRTALGDACDSSVFFANWCSAHNPSHYLDLSCHFLYFMDCQSGSRE